MLIFILLGIVMGGVSVIFVLQNITPITVTFLTWQLSGSMALVLGVAVVMGAIVAMLVLIPSLVRDEYRYNQIAKKNKQLDDDLYRTKKELDELKARTTELSSARAAPADLPAAY